MQMHFECEHSSYLWKSPRDRIPAAVKRCPPSYSCNTRTRNILPAVLLSVWWQNTATRQLVSELKERIEEGKWGGGMNTLLFYPNIYPIVPPGFVFIWLVTTFLDGRTTAEGLKIHKPEHQFTAFDTFIKNEATASINTFYEPAYMLLNPKTAC